MARPIRVLELRSVRGTGGGPDKTILLGTAATDRRKYEITVCYLRNAKDTAYTIDSWAGRLGLDYTEFHERWRLDPPAALGLVRLVRSRRIDIIHAHDYKTNLLAWLVARFTRAVPLSTVHGWSGVSWREQRLYYPCEKYLLSRFPKLIAVSRAIQDELVCWGAPPDRVTLIPNGIDHRRFIRSESGRRAARLALGIPDDSFVIGTVGRLEEEKRYDLLVEAFAALHPKRPRTCLILVGDGSQRQALDELIAGHHLQGACRLLGHRSDMLDLYQAFDVFVQSSDTEGTSNALLEAMALEVPIVATNVGGTPDLIADECHGLLVPRRNVSALAAGIERTIADRAATGRRTGLARLRVEGELSFESRMKRVESVYEELRSLFPPAFEALPSRELTHN
jgi:glycosyltransferase involved in cell wall biosynthesis